MCTRPKNYFTDKNGIVGHDRLAEKNSVSSGTHGCGYCYECRALDRNQKTIRGAMEATQYDSNLFVTLTYNNEHLPDGGSLRKSDVQKFFKRLKKYFGSNESNPIRQIYAGEYGSDGRPHYHAIIFNCSFKDMFLHRYTDEGHAVFRSHTLEFLWSKGKGKKRKSMGFCEFTHAAPENIAYVYKYIIKKKSKKYRKDLVDRDTGLILEHEFVHASQNPGIGAFLKNSPTINKGFLVYNGKKYPLPLYYKRHLVKTGQRDKLLKIEGNALDITSYEDKPSDTKREEYYSLINERKRLNEN